MKLEQSFYSYGGEQKVYNHFSRVNNCNMKFAVFLPYNIKNKKLPVLWYLSGLTCTHANVMEKGEYRKKASELGIAVICPDTSPRGENVPDEKDNWKFGLGAGFYLDATTKIYSKNYNMFTYINSELSDLIFTNFPLDENNQSIMGHSMGGHGALIFSLKNQKKFRSCSAFSPIVEPSTSNFGVDAFKKYLGNDEKDWRKYDTIKLIEDGAFFPKILVDQGTKDEFLNDLKPSKLKHICDKKNINLTLRMQEGYDHSYYFISTFMSDHIEWHNKNFKI